MTQSGGPIDFSLTFGWVARGLTSRLSARDAWHAMNTPSGPVTLHACVDGERVEVEAWGPGREWVLEHAPDIVGTTDRPPEFDSALLRDLAYALRGLRMTKLGCALDISVATVIEQRVTGREAARTWRMLLRRFGTPAPGPAPLVVPPDAEQLLAIRDWEWRRMGVEGRRSMTVRRVAAEANRPRLVERLRFMRGIGPWTLAKVAHVVCGDADIVPVGDWHFPRHVAFAFAGEHFADDARMLELLEPFRPHRGRVLRLLLAGTPGPPRHAPRAPIVNLMELESSR